MAVELVEIAAGLPMAASFALVSGISSLREGRRRASLNEAMHELRRPLQVLALSLPGEREEDGACDSSLQMATAALDRLDREINGGAVERGRESVAIEPLLRNVVRRWRQVVTLHGRTLRLRTGVWDCAVTGNEFELEQALDNLIKNALEHGGGAMTIGAREIGGRLRLTVFDDGPLRPPRKIRGAELRERLSGRARHGHGLRVVARVARSHGGSFELRRMGGRTEARFELPLRPKGEQG
ncbi:MAG TPA: HAMP domain-containing sensor histidine kinase [Solirubrobacterales bacterium]|nr:HAMP domain-containing sensor histidine kinase [Solirubrobacterales bacterium]